MLVFRAIGLLLVFGTAGSIVLWLLTGDNRYRRLAWMIFRAGLVAAFALLATFAFERLLAPIV